MRRLIIMMTATTSKVRIVNVPPGVPAATVRTLWRRAGAQMLLWHPPQSSFTYRQLIAAQPILQKGSPDERDPSRDQF